MQIIVEWKENAKWLQPRSSTSSDGWKNTRAIKIQSIYRQSQTMSNGSSMSDGAKKKKMHNNGTIETCKFTQANCFFQCIRFIPDCRLDILQCNYLHCRHVFLPSYTILFSFFSSLVSLQLLYERRAYVHDVRCFDKRSGGRSMFMWKRLHQENGIKSKQKKSNLFLIWFLVAPQEISLIRRMLKTNTKVNRIHKQLNTQRTMSQPYCLGLLRKWIYFKNFFTL